MTLAGITFNSPDDTNGWYFNEPSECDGIAGVGTQAVPLRTTLDDAPLTDGGLRGTTYKAARVVTIGGIFVAPGPEERTQLIDDLAEALDSIVNAPGTLSWQLAGGDTRSLVVYHDAFLKITGALEKTYLFGLVAPDPTIT